MVSKELPQAQATTKNIQSGCVYKFKNVIELHLYYKTVEIFLEHTLVLSLSLS